MKKYKKMLFLFGVLLGLTGCAEGTVVSNVPEGALEVHYIDVGQGDCILLASEGQYMLIDGGNNGDDDIIIPYLQNLGVEKLDMVVGTHPHEDHIGALDDVLENFDVDAFYMPTITVNTKTYQDVLDAVAAEGLEVQHPMAGDMLEFNGLPVEVLGPVKEYSDLNNNSIVMRISVGETSFLFTGDIEAKAEFDILKEGYDVKADVLKVAHHGSSGSSVEEFLAYTDADYGIISVGTGNVYNHPEAPTLKRLKNYGIDYYRTDTQGTVVCTTDGQNISFDLPGESTPSVEKPGVNYIGNKNTMKYHTPDCGSLPTKKNCVTFENKKEAQKEGYAPCGSCKP